MIKYIMPQWQHHMQECIALTCLAIQHVAPVRLFNVKNYQKTPPAQLPLARHTAH